MNKYKRNNNIIVITVAVFLIVISMLIYNFYFKDYVENNKTDIKKESLYINITDENIINEILNTIEVNNLDDIASFEKNIDNINILEPVEKLSIAYNSIKKDIQNEIDVIELDNYFKSSIKTTIYYDKSGIYCINGEVLYKFDMSQNKYIYNNEHDCESHDEINAVYTKVVEAKKKNNTYVITVNHIWNKSLQKDIMYSSYKDALNEKEKLFIIPSDEDITNFINNSYDEIKDKLHKYTYVFDKKDDKYLLESIKYE